MAGKKRKTFQFQIPENWQHAIFHTSWHLLGTLLPLIIATILSFLFFCTEHIKHFITEGEFCILSAAVATPASYILSQYSKDERNRIRMMPSIVYFTSIAIILITSIIFAGVYMHSMFNILRINETLIEIMSISFLIIAGIVFFIAQLLPGIYDKGANAKKSEVHDIELIDKEFDNLP